MGHAAFATMGYMEQGDGRFLTHQRCAGAVATGVCTLAVLTFRYFSTRAGCVMDRFKLHYGLHWKVACPRSPLPPSSFVPFSPTSCVRPPSAAPWPSQGPTLATHALARVRSLPCGADVQWVATLAVL